MRASAPAVVAFVGLFLIFRASASAPRAESAVRLLELDDGGACSCVVLSPRRALTAAHCLHPGMRVDGRAVVGEPLAKDLAQLYGDFEPPYARIAAAPRRRLFLEGWGCDPDPGWPPGRRVPHREVRAARLLGIARGRAGYELELSGRLCLGDSGGAVWNAGGNLAGIMTATATEPPVRGKVGFATWPTARPPTPETPTSTEN